MATDEGKTLEDSPTATLSMDGGTQTVRLPSGWALPGTAAKVRRVGETVVLEPIVHAPAEVPDAHAGVPPGYWEWLDGARARGEFDHDEVERFDIEFRDLDLDDVP